VQWEKKLGGLGNDYGLGIILDNDAGYMVHSDKSHWYPELGGVNRGSTWIIRLNALGDSLSSIDFNSGSPNTNSPVAFDIIQTDDGHFILVGKEWKINFRGGSWLVKLDSNCKSIFNFTPSSESTNSRLGQIFSALLPTNEGGVFIAGANLGEYNFPWPHWFLEERNSAGDLLWKDTLKQEIKVYRGFGPKPKALINHSQGEFAILADTALVLFDTTGTEEWMPTPGSSWSSMIKFGASSALLAGTRDGRGYLARYDFEPSVGMTRHSKNGKSGMVAKKVGTMLEIKVEESLPLEIVLRGLHGEAQQVVYKGRPSAGKLSIPISKCQKGVHLLTMRSGSKQVYQLMILR
jgi:hypothetical protein